jgi:NADH dehydrogenase
VLVSRIIAQEAQAQSGLSKAPGACRDEDAGAVPEILKPWHATSFHSLKPALSLFKWFPQENAMATTLGNNSVVTVFGGSGFLGRYVVQALARAGCRIKVAVRRPDLALHLQPLGSVGQIALMQANLRDERSVSEALRGADAAVNLVGILQPGGRQKFRAVHVEGAERIAKASRERGARALVHISAIGASRLSSSAYARTKGEGEARVQAIFPEAVILRPSLIFGPEDDFFNRFAALARIAPVMPLIGGKTRMQPVYAGDVAEAVKAALGGPAGKGVIYELGGPLTYSFREILKKTGEWAGHRRPLFPIPFWIAKIPAFFIQWIPGAPVTVDQIRLLERNNVVSADAAREQRTLQGLGIAEPRSIESIVPLYLQRYRRGGEFSTGRVSVS